MKIRQEDTFKHCDYLEELLNYIRSLIPNDVKGHILEDRYCFAERSLRPYTKQVVVMFYCFSILEDLLEKLCSKNVFLVQLHSAVSNNIKNAPHHRCFP